MLRTNRLLLLSSIVLLQLCLEGRSWAAPPGQVSIKRILIIDSFSSLDTWTNELKQGLKSCLNRDNRVLTTFETYELAVRFKPDFQPAPEDIAAIVIEPVQGEGGFYASSPAFMQRLRALCDEHGIMLIADEVQSGAGRTGTLFAMEQMGVAPDLTTFAKSIAGGFPLAGVTGRAEVMDAVAPGGLGGTYAGNPIACVAALEVLKVFEQENLLQKANDLGQKLKDGLLAIAEKHPEIGDVRGLGAMIAIELFEDGDHNKPDAKLTAEIVARARDKGLILLSCGPYYNVLRILVPLTIEDAQIRQGLEIISQCFDEAKQ